ncbi:glycosyltransferase [Streptomyces olivaceoviridis]
MREVRVLLSTYGSRGDVEPLAGLAARLRGLGAQVRVCAPPDEDFARRLAEVGVPLVPVGPSARALTKAAPPPASLPRRAAELIAGQLDTVTEAAQGCDVLVATGMLPAAAGALSVAERLGVRSVSVTFQQLTLPAPHRRPPAYPGRPLPPEVTDNEVLWELDARNADALFAEALNTNRASVGLPPVYVGFGSMPLHAAADIGQVAVEAVRAQGRRVVVARGWAGLSPAGDRDDCFVVGEVNQQALFGRVAAVVHHGGAGTTTTAARAGVPQVVVPQAADQPYWAGRVAELGIGAAHEGPTPTFASLSAALRTALAPTTRGRAAALAGRVRTDGASVAARLLLDAHG